MIRVGLDSNILIYFAGIVRRAEDEAKIAVVRKMIDRIGRAATLIAPAQALGEVFTVMRRTRISANDARTTVMEFVGAFGGVGSGPATLLAAADLAVDHKLQLWDALIVTAATEAGCSILLSEDMQHGFVTRGLTIVNPLAEGGHPRLAALLDA